MGPGVTLPGSRAPFSLRSSFTRSAYLPRPVVTYQHLVEA